MRPAVIMMYRDEADILPWSLAHWYRLGVRDFYLCDNLSVDGSNDCCEWFKNTHPYASVKLFTDTREDWPGRDRINAMKVQAIQDGCDWIFPADADEFLELPVEYYSLQRFLSDLNPGGNQCAYQLDYLNILPNGHRFWQRPQQKVFGRFAPDWTISMGNHEIENRKPDLLAAQFKNAYYRHYGIRSYDQFRRKMVNWWTAFHNGPHQTHPHAQYWYRWQSEGEPFIQNLYEKCLQSSQWPPE